MAAVTSPFPLPLYKFQIRCSSHHSPFTTAITTPTPTKMSILPLPLTVFISLFLTFVSSASVETLNVNHHHHHHRRHHQDDPDDKAHTFINPKLPPTTFTDSKKNEGSSEFVKLRYHMGPVLSSPINIYLIWYGKWTPSQKLTIKDFILSISTTNRRAAPQPSVSDWWKTVTLYTDQTNANISGSVLIAGECSDRKYSHGTHLTRLTVQDVIASNAQSARFPVDHRTGVFLLLTSSDVSVQDFCRAVCGFHYFTFPSKVGYTLPYAWVGNSATQCPEVCAYPFAVPAYMGGGGPGSLAPPNGDVGVEGMISVIGHELAELASNPLVNAWYAGEDPTAPTEIGDLCEGLYGSGGGGGYIGQVMKDGSGRTFNMNGRRGRKFMVQWIWSPVFNACRGPNALD